MRFCDIINFVDDELEDDLSSFRYVLGFKVPNSYFYSEGVREYMFESLEKLEKRSHECDTILFAVLRYRLIARMKYIYDRGGDDDAVIHQLKCAYKHFVSLNIRRFEECINVLVQEAGIAHKNKCYDVSDKLRDYLYELGVKISYDNVDKDECTWIARIKTFPE